MGATFVQLGEPAHDAQRQALRVLVEGLPSSYAVYANAWLVEPTGVIVEFDAVVVAPHGIFVVDIRADRGRVEGNDNDWWLPEKLPSPLKRSQRSAQVLRRRLKSMNNLAGQVGIEAFIFVSITTDCAVRGPASTARVHTRKSILAALQDAELFKQLTGSVASSPSSHAASELRELLTSAASDSRRPLRSLRNYRILETLSHQQRYAELLGRNSLDDSERVLRLYPFPPVATQEQLARVTERARWEAQVLGRLGRIEGVLSADSPFSDDEAGIVLPFERFKGVSLTTWLDRYGPDARGKERAELRVRTDLWLRLASAINDVHRHGVIHRLLRPEVVLVEDAQEPQASRITGFDLAKQLSSESTISLSTVHDDRLVFAAPEVVGIFSSAEPASDQFSLGVLLAFLLTGKPLFENTRQLIAQRKLMRRVRDIAPRLPLSLDEAVSRMVSIRPTERFASIDEAIEAVRAGRDPSPRVALSAAAQRPAVDPDNLQPGARLGTDYEVVSRLGQGGMSVVYAARHLVSGRTRALKISRAEPHAEGALSDEFEVLSHLDHPNIVRVIDLTKMVEGRLTMVMERVSGLTLRQWLGATQAPAPATQRSLAECLFAGLDYLEQKAITHKDLKPENLLVSDSQLTIIDFSLASMSDEASYGGTALYRDPATARWTHATDRYAAALCLFELYAGRHAFDGHAPEPSQTPFIADDELQPSGLVAFFRKALDPVAERRFSSARAMREALLIALGEDAPSAPHGSMPPPRQLDASTSVHLSGLSPRAINALVRTQVRTVGDLLALSPAQVRAIHAIGTKTAGDVIALQTELRARGIESGPSAAPVLEPVLLPELTDSLEPLQKLPVNDALRAALSQWGLSTIGQLASSTHSALRAVPGIGRKKHSEVVEALHRFAASASDRPDSAQAHTLDKVWDLASLPLTDAQRIAIERFVGITGAPEPQGKIAESLGKSQPQVSVDCTAGLGRLDTSALAELSTHFEDILDGFGGVVRIDELGARIETQWAAGMVTGEGIVRLLVRISQGRAELHSFDVSEHAVVARTGFAREALQLFFSEVLRMASQWPPLDPESARRTLAARLPGFHADVLSLGVRICDDVQLAETGHLFVGPVDPPLSIQFVLDRCRDSLTLDQLKARVRQVFGESTPFPEPDHLIEVLRSLDCKLSNGVIEQRRGGSLLAPAPLASDLPPPSLGSDRSPEQIVRDMLCDERLARGFRMLVVPPERLAEIGRSVAAAIDATWVSFDDAFFAQHAASLPSLERAERFVAQRAALSEAAEETLSSLLEEHGRRGRRIVLGDTALFGLCDVLDLPRRLYDESLSGDLGLWVLVVPGVIRDRQPRFNEGPAMWHLEGATLPLQNPLPR